MEHFAGHPLDLADEHVRAADDDAEREKRLQEDDGVLGLFAYPRLFSISGIGSMADSSTSPR